jgi:hypothetical protein
VTTAAVLGLIAVGGLLGPPAARGDSVIYTISGNTAGLAGTGGYLDFQFNPAAPAAPAATATITGLSTDGTLIESTVITGGASGSLPGTVKIVNSTGLNEAMQQLTYGTKLSFNLSLTFTPDTVNGTTFAFLFLDPNSPANGYSKGPSGEAVDITVFTATDIEIRGPFGPASNSPGFPSTPTLTVVPEPSGLVLLGLGVGVMAMAGYEHSRRRRRAA